ncbi:MAG: ABC transporter permease [Hyphomicrobiales bacterium]|nr:ABC transporter permease [Hyphomicrobiales bacterium]
MHSPVSRARAFAMDYGFYILLLAIVIVFTFISNSFLTISNWAQIAIASTFLLAAAAGLTLVLVTGEIDLSIGSIAYVAATVVFLTSDMPAAVSILAALGIGFGIGLFNGWLVAYLGMNSLLTTLGLMIAYRGVSLVFTEGTVKPVADGLAVLGRVKVFGTIPLIFLVALALVILFQWVLRATKLGTFWLAIGNNEDSARKIGVPVRRAKLAAYALCGISAATSGLLLAAYLGEITTFTGRGMEFQAVAAVVIGGTSLFGGRGNVLPGTLAGVFLLIVINNGLGTRGVSPFVYPFVAGGLIFFAIYLDSIKNRARRG